MVEHRQIPSVTVADLLARSYTQFAGLPAIGSLTYGGLGHRVASLRSALHALQLRKGDRAILLTANCPEFLEVEHALFTSGLIRVALSSRLHPREVAHIIRDCDAAVVFAEESWTERLSAIQSEIPSVRHVIGFDFSPPGSNTVLPYEDLLAGGSPDPDLPVPAPDDVAALLYTSGTTGMPKGAALTHRS